MFEVCCQEATAGMHGSVYSHCMRREITDGMAELHRRMVQAAVKNRPSESVRIMIHLDDKYSGLQLLVNALESIPEVSVVVFGVPHSEFGSKIPVYGGEECRRRESMNHPSPARLPAAIRITRVPHEVLNDSQ